MRRCLSPIILITFLSLLLVSCGHDSRYHIAFSECVGGTSSSPAIDRHKGFSEAMRDRKDIDYSFINTDWTPEDTYAKVKDYLKSHSTPDILFCHSDLTAFYARKAADELGLADKIRFLGIDGLPGKGEGIEGVEKGVLAGTYIYPTHGQDIMKLSLNILQGQSYKRENIIRSVIVTPDNADLLQQTSMEMERQSRDLLTLQDKLENYLGLYKSQRTAIIATIAIIALLFVVLVLVWRVVVVVRRANKKEKELNREQTLFYTNARHQLRTPLTLIDGPVKELAQSNGLSRPRVYQASEESHNGPHVREQPQDGRHRRRHGHQPRTALP